MTHIMDGIYEQLPEPLARNVFLQFSRALMEDEANQVKVVTDKCHILNDHNLKEINEVIREGMWGGKVEVVQAGSRLTEEAGDSCYKRYPDIAGRS
jgi:hypothetical protein